MSATRLDIRSVISITKKEGAKSMIETLHEILTNSESRSNQAIQNKLEDNTSAGTPWFN